MGRGGCRGRRRGEGRRRDCRPAAGAARAAPPTAGRSAVTAVPLRARAALVAWLSAVRPRRAHLKADLFAALSGAVSNVPEAMATSVLAGVSPVNGLYAAFAGPIAGG